MKLSAESVNIISTIVNVTPNIVTVLYYLLFYIKKKVFKILNQLSIQLSLINPGAGVIALNCLFIYIC